MKIECIREVYQVESWKDGHTYSIQPESTTRLRINPLLKVRAFSKPGAGPVYSGFDDFLSGLPWVYRREPFQNLLVFFICIYLVQALTISRKTFTEFFFLLSFCRFLS